jgi:glycosyltransferase involved in cell wall biosynthesis
MDDSRGKVLIVTSVGGDRFGRTSSEVVVARHLVDRGYTVQCIAKSEGEFADMLRDMGVEVVARAYAADARKVKNRAAQAFGIGALARRYAGYDCVLATRLSSTPLALAIGRRIDAPVISYLQGYALQPEKYVRYDVHRVDMVIAASGHVRSCYTDDTEGVRSSEQRVEMILNGIDADAFCASASEVDARAAFSIPSDVDLVGMAGASFRKGTDVFARAAALVSAERPDTHFLVAGQFVPESFGAELLGIVEPAGLTSRFHFLGYQLDISAIMRACDVWAMPSREDAFPVAGLEVQAVGTPMVASAVGGIPEMVLEGEAGFLVPKEDPDALADRFLRLLNDHELRTRMGERAHRFIREELPLHRQVEEFERCVESLIRRDSPSQPVKT